LIIAVLPLVGWGFTAVAYSTLGIGYCIMSGKAIFVELVEPAGDTVSVIPKGVPGARGVVEGQVAHLVGFFEWQVLNGHTKMLNQREYSTMRR
jgi:hypothetical protein